MLDRLQNKKTGAKLATSLSQLKKKLNETSNQPLKKIGSSPNSDHQTHSRL